MYAHIGFVACSCCNEVWTTGVHAPSTAVYSDDDEDLPVTSFACQWKELRKRKESTLKIADADFEKHVYRRE